jgi:hypothetical protein
MLRKILHADLVSMMSFRITSLISIKLVAVFVPLLMLEKGLEVWQVCAFYAGYTTCKLGLDFPSAWFINRYGARCGLVVDALCVTVFMVTLTGYILSGTTRLLCVMALMMAIQHAFLFKAQYLHISRAMDEKRTSRDLATMESILRLISAVVPFIGGVIAASLGRWWLTAIAAMFAAASLIPAWRLDTFGGGHQRADKLSYRLRGAPVGDLIANAGYSLHSSVVWFVCPIYLAVSIASPHAIGMITAFGTLVAIVVLRIAGKRGDGGHGSRVLIEGAATSSVMHLVRMAATSNPLALAIIGALQDVAGGYQSNSWLGFYCAHARKGGLNYLLAMEVVAALTSALMWSACAAIAYFTGDESFFVIVFGVAAVAVWLTTFIRRASAPNILALEREAPRVNEPWGLFSYDTAGNAAI